MAREAVSLLQSAGFRAVHLDLGPADLAEPPRRLRVVSGDAKGAIGVVTGKHGGVNHVLIDFAQADL